MVKKLKKKGKKKPKIVTVQGLSGKRDVNIDLLKKKFGKPRKKKSKGADSDYRGMSAMSASYNKNKGKKKK